MPKVIGGSGKGSKPVKLPKKIGKKPA